MAKKRKEAVELRFYDIPQGEPVLALLGDNWTRVYGHEESKLHFHNLMEIGICRRGEGDVYLDLEKKSYSNGTVTILPENFPHTTYSAGEVPNAWEYFYFNPKEIISSLFPENPVYQNEILEAINASGLIFFEEEKPELSSLINNIMTEMRRQKPFYRQMIQGYLKNLVLELMRRHGELEKFGASSSKGTNLMQISSALDYMSEHYAQPLKAKDLADVCSMSETHFRRLFDEYVNMSPMDYLNLIRVQRACELMKKTDDPMDVVAAKCGFGNTSTFNRNFRKFLDTSPYQWKINPNTYEKKMLNYRITALKGW